MINEALGEECEAMIIEAITDLSVERVNTMTNQRCLIICSTALKS